MGHCSNRSCDDARHGFAVRSDYVYGDRSAYAQTIPEVLESPMMNYCRPYIAIVVLTILLGVNVAQANERILQFMEDRWTHALMHHAGDGTGDSASDAPLGLGKADCVDKRALDRRQRIVARRLGQILERSGVHIDLIATSAWCRAIETAHTLELRPVTVETALNAAAPDDADAADRALELLDIMRRSETALLVTHTGNIKALTGRDSNPGEIIVVRVRPGEDLEVIGAFELE